MAPSSENIIVPKAPDKNKSDKHGNVEFIKEKNKDFKTLNNLNDCELKDLLDEAITYKNPKDREGKSTLFKELLSQAEESERNARAASAGGSEQVRYCNTSAKRSKHRRKPNSISENMMHGGSLDNLANEELFEVSLDLNIPKRTVSARQREGGSLPSNVNAGIVTSYDPHFLEEARRKRTVRGGGPPEPMEIDMETASLLDHDSVAQNYESQHNFEVIEIESTTPKFTTTLQVDVDGAIHLGLDTVDKKSSDNDSKSSKGGGTSSNKYNCLMPPLNFLSEPSKKVDENANALHQNTLTKGKRKKIQGDKNVTNTCFAEKLEGHRSDIIHDVKKLLAYIGECDYNKSNKSKCHKNNAEEGSKNGKKHRGKGKGNCSNQLKKSNSLEEISTSNLENFTFNDAVHDENKQGDNKVVFRAKEDKFYDKSRERRSWDNVEHPGIQNFYLNPTMDIETASSSSSEFRVVMKKKKMKKYILVNDNHKSMSTMNCDNVNSSKSDSDRNCSSILRRKSACSVPHSEKSNDSSDVDSVHSLPTDTSQRIMNSSEETPISYADIARNSERKLHQHHDTQRKISPDSKLISNHKYNIIDSVSSSYDGTTKMKYIPQSLPAHVSENNIISVDSSDVNKTIPAAVPKVTPPDVHNIRSFPAIQSNTNKPDKSGKIEIKNNNNNNFKGGNYKLQQVKQENFVQCNNVNNLNKNIKNQNDTSRQSDIQNDLSIIQANEMDTIQFNSQIITSIQIPDVQTIEKIHFMSQPGGHMPSHLQHIVPQHIHIASHHQQSPQIESQHHAIPVTPINQIFTNGRNPTGYTTIINHSQNRSPGSVTYVKAAQAYEGVGVTYVGTNANIIVPNVIDGRCNNLVTVTTQTNNTNPKSKKVEDENASSANSKLSKPKYNKKSNYAGVAHYNNNNNNNNDNKNNINNDFSVSRPMQQRSRSLSHSSNASTVIANSDAAPVGAESSSSSVRDDSTCSSNCDNKNASDTTSNEDSFSDSRPPVVILSGLNSSKEVPGLVFGFDINEQLLSEDICENFVQRFISPKTYTTISHNHDKIVNYIGTAWEEILKFESLGKARYYSDNL